MRPLKGLLSPFLTLAAFILSSLLAVINVFWLLPGIAEAEAAAWVLLAALCILLVQREGRLPLLRTWIARAWTLWPFVLFAGLTVFWSIAWQVSLSRWITLAALVIVGAYIGLASSTRRLVAYLSIFGVLILTLSGVLVWLVPGHGVMNYHSIQGAWKGVFWHKNHMGLMAGFACITFLLSALGSLQDKSRWWWFWGAFYVLSLLFVSQTDSVATYMSLIVLHVVILVLMGHARLKARLRGHHYWVFAAVLVLLLAAVYLNRDWVLALFNRNSSLTGRVPLWGHLLGTYVAQHPLGGYGLNAFWHLPSHRIAMQLAAGYPDQIVVSDNGFLDLLLNMGFVGIVLFFLFYFDLWRRALNLAWRATDVFGLFPLIAMVYILVANLTWSLLFENESFFMLTMIAMAFLMAGEGNRSARDSSKDDRKPRRTVAAMP